MSDRLIHGISMEIERRVYKIEAKDVAALIMVSPEELRERREKSAAAEDTIFGTLCENADAWETQARETMLLDAAMEYFNQPATEHTANRWQPDEYGNNQEISNMVYKMYYRPEAETKYDREAGQHVPVAWKLTWRVLLNTPVEGHRIVLDGQDKKRFPDEAAMEKYLQGRIKAYSHLFAELSPVIPRQYAHRFSIHGQLLPGYRTEGQERPSALNRLTAAKDTVAKKDADRPKAEKTARRGKEGDSL